MADPATGTVWHRFTPARRRIDLLGVDRDGRLVVIELKRTTDGGHLELQALRYAAMVSVMTFDDLVEHHERYLAQVEPEAVDEARARLADFLEDAGGEDTVLSREVRLVLVAGGFDREITTTVLWLTDVYGGRTGPLRKRWAVLTMATALHRAGVTAHQLTTAIPRSRFLPVDGTLSGEELTKAFLATYPGSTKRLGRWFLDAPLHDLGRTWVVSKMWGHQHRTRSRPARRPRAGRGLRLRTDRRQRRLTGLPARDRSAPSPANRRNRRGDASLVQKKDSHVVHPLEVARLFAGQLG